MRYLELDTNGRVINIIIWDGITPYDPGYTLIPCTDAPHATYGWQLIDGQWVAPPAAEEQ